MTGNKQLITITQSGRIGDFIVESAPLLVSEGAFDI
jgi:hypothetical protein